MPRRKKTEETPGGTAQDSLGARRPETYAGQPAAKVEEGIERSLLKAALEGDQDAREKVLGALRGRPVIASPPRLLEGRWQLAFEVIAMGGTVSEAARVSTLRRPHISTAKNDPKHKLYQALELYRQDRWEALQQQGQILSDIYVQRLAMIGLDPKTADGIIVRAAKTVFGVFLPHQRGEEQEQKAPTIVIETGRQAPPAETVRLRQARQSGDRAAMLQAVRDDVAEFQVVLDALQNVDAASLAEDRPGNVLALQR